MIQEKATIESQLYGGICPVTDTEEMFWLREADDYQSKVKLGMLLVGQYRYLDAIHAFEEALHIKNDEAALYNKLGGACLSVFQFEKAKYYYDQAKRHGMSSKTLAYPMAVWHYLQKEYEEAAECFEKCLPCGDEMKIAVIYWHMITSLHMHERLDKQKILKESNHQHHVANVVNIFKIAREYDSSMNVGHHEAYKWAVEVMLSQVPVDEMLGKIEHVDELSYIVAAYGIATYLSCIENNQEKSNEIIQKLLTKTSMWPCISYLAAYRDSR